MIQVSYFFFFFPLFFSLLFSLLPSPFSLPSPFFFFSCFFLKFTFSQCPERIGGSDQVKFENKYCNQPTSKRHSCWKKTSHWRESFARRKTRKRKPGMHGKSALFPKLSSGWMTACWLARRVPGIEHGFSAARFEFHH